MASDAKSQSVEELLSENEMLKQQLDDLKHLYRDLYKADVNTALKGLNASKVDQALYKELKFEKARRMQMERMVQRLQKAADIRRECISEVENFGLEVKAMSEEASMGSDGIDLAYLKNWSNSFLQRMRSLHLQTEKAERQGLFLPGSGYVNENVLGIEGLCISEIVQGRLQDIPYINTYNLAILENRLNDLYKYACKLGYTVKHSLIANHHAFEEQLVQDTVVSDVQMLLQQIDTVRREISHLGAIVPSKFEINTIKKRKDDKSTRDSLAFSSDDAEEPLSYLTINTKELIQKLPKFSRSPSECEASLRALAKCINTQKHIWNLEKEMLTEEVIYHQKMYRAYKLYTSEMLTQIDQLQKRYLPTPEKPSNSMLDIKCIESIYQCFKEFDEEATESNLKQLLLSLKTNESQINHLLNTFESKSSSSSNRNIHKDLSMLSRECEIIENEYKMKLHDMLGRKYELEENLMQREMYMNFVPYTVPLSEEKPNTLYNVNEDHVRTERFNIMDTSPPRQSISQYSGQDQQIRPGRPQRRNSVTSVSSSIHSDISLGQNTDRSARATKKTRPPVKIEKKPTSTLPPNVVELQELVDESQIKVDEMESRLESERLTSMQQYALKRQIALEKATLKKHERTLKNLTG